MSVEDLIEDAAPLVVHGPERGREVHVTQSLGADTLVHARAEELGIVVGVSLFSQLALSQNLVLVVELLSPSAQDGQAVLLGLTRGESIERFAAMKAAVPDRNMIVCNDLFVAGEQATGTPGIQTHVDEFLVSPEAVFCAAGQGQDVNGCTSLEADLPRTGEK